MMIRGILTSCVEGMIKRFSALGLIDVMDRELFQHYGFTSLPKKGAEVIYLVEGNVVIAIASDDRRYRLKIEDGEAALYDDLEQKVHLTRTGIVVDSPIRITATSPEINLGGAREALRMLIDERILELLNSHTHSGIKGGSDISGPPVATITTDMVCTTMTRAI